MSMDPQMFKEKILLLSDPYFDREFFSNLITCIDRKATPREIFLEFLRNLNLTESFSAGLDRSLLQLFYSYQATSIVRESYQWLPLTQGLMAASLFRSDGKAPLPVREWKVETPTALTARDFAELIPSSVRGVQNFDATWTGLLFLLETRSERSQAIASLVRASIRETDALTAALLLRAIDLSFSTGWKASAEILHRPFRRFWAAGFQDALFQKGARLSHGVQLSWSEKGGSEVAGEHVEELWRRVSRESAESAWEYARQLISKMVLPEELFGILAVLRGRCLYTMETDQWQRVTSSLLLSDALQSAARWVPEDVALYLAMDIADLSEVAPLVSVQQRARPDGQSIKDGTSRNIPKDRLILRLDDCIERGEGASALSLLKVILDDSGLSHSVTDRLLLSAAKQDGWTYDMKTIATAVVVTKAYQTCLRHGLRGAAIEDALYGFVRFLVDQRERATGLVKQTGTYGDRQPKSQYDVSSGARIVERYVFNQMRNAQRVKIWPLDN